MKKTAVLFMILFIVLCLIFVLVYHRTIFQEGNPWPYLKSIISLQFGGNQSVYVNQTTNLLMTKSTNGQKPIDDLLDKQNYQFYEQMGSGYFYINQSGESIIITRRHYSRWYYIWHISESRKTFDITENLNQVCETQNDCELPFDYAIRSVCPYEVRCLMGQCQVVCPIKENNWPLIVDALKNCQVQQVMQAHSLQVEARLKNNEVIFGIEPQIDDIIHLAVEAREKCDQDLIISTE